MTPFFLLLAWIVAAAALFAKVGWILATAIMFCYFVGFAATIALTTYIGERSPNTLDDSITGDEVLECWLIALWPITLPCLAAYYGVRALCDVCVRS